MKLLLKKKNIYMNKQLNKNKLNSNKYLVDN